MKRLLALLGSVAAALALAATAHAASRPRVLAIHFSLEINPVTQDYVNHQLDRAQKDHYDAAVILLDTPGGLSSSMESIYKKELASKIPVIVYIAPKGAAAASAGVFVSEAADVLAMAPDTNIGSSTPIDQSGGNLGSDLRRKVINHFAAKLRSLAENHGRNGDWADKAVRKASNLTEQEALRIHVIDVLAPDLPTLLRKIDGRVTIPNHYKLHTANAQITYASPTFFTRLLNTLIDPNLITLLFLAGLAGIGYEIFHPGVVLPGALGAVALVTALFGFSVLPISWAGLALLVLGLALLVIDAHVASHGALTVSGLIAFVIGALMLFRNAPAPYHANLWLIVSIAAVLGSAWAFAITKAIQVRRTPVSVGPQTIVGEIGEFRGDGQVFVRGELWRAKAPEGQLLRRGQKVRIDGVEPGLVLDVEPLDQAEQATVS
ncbi:MAG: nodulation protein NfeD [Actinobacteria bacterium]|nr:MAG: nodulation protein NfeD [Actinomycetota bacterium]